MAIERDEQLCEAYMKGKEGEVEEKVRKRYVELCEKWGKLLGIDEFLSELGKKKV